MASLNKEKERFEESFEERLKKWNDELAQKLTTIYTSPPKEPSSFLQYLRLPKEEGFPLEPEKEEPVKETAELDFGDAISKWGRETIEKLIAAQLPKDEEEIERALKSFSPLLQKFESFRARKEIVQEPELTKTPEVKTEIPQAIPLKPPKPEVQVSKSTSKLIESYVPESELELPQETIQKLEPFIDTVKKYVPIPTTPSEAKKALEGLKLGVIHTIGYTWPKQIEDLTNLLKKLDRYVEEKTKIGKIPQLQAIDEAVRSIAPEWLKKLETEEVELPKIKLSEKDIEKLKDPTFRAWLTAGSFIADLPRIVGFSYILGPVFGPIFSSLNTLVSPILSRLATNPTLFKVAERFLARLPQRVITDSLVFSALSAPNVEEMVRGAEAGTIFGVAAGLTRKAQPLAVGLAAFVNAIREGAPKEEATWHALLFGTFNRFMPHSEQIFRRILKQGGLSEKEIDQIEFELLKSKYTGELPSSDVLQKVNKAFEKGTKRYSIFVEDLVSREIDPEKLTRIVSQVEEAVDKLSKEIKLDRVEEVAGVLQNEVNYSLSVLSRNKKALDKFKNRPWEFVFDLVNSASQRLATRISEKEVKSAEEKAILQYLPKARSLIMVEKVRELVPLETFRVELPTHERAEALSKYLSEVLRKEDSTIKKELDEIAEQSKRIPLSDEKSRIDLERRLEDVENKIFKIEVKELEKLLGKRDLEIAFLERIYKGLVNVMQKREPTENLPELKPLTFEGKPYEGLEPGSKEWQELWSKASPELRKEMLLYRREVERKKLAERPPRTEEEKAVPSLPEEAEKAEIPEVREEIVEKPIRWEPVENYSTLKKGDYVRVEYKGKIYEGEIVGDPKRMRTGAVLIPLRSDDGVEKLAPWTPKARYEKRVIEEEAPERPKVLLEPREKETIEKEYVIPGDFSPIDIAGRKYPWQLTKREWENAVKELLDFAQKELKGEIPDLKEIDRIKALEEVAGINYIDLILALEGQKELPSSDIHRQAVERALLGEQVGRGERTAERIKIPKEVLQDYPDLVERFGKSVEEIATIPQRFQKQIENILNETTPKEQEFYVYQEETGTFVKPPSKAIPIKISSEEAPISSEAIDLFTYYDPKSNNWVIVAGKTGRIIDTAPSLSKAKHTAAKIMTSEKANDILEQIRLDIYEGRLSPRWGKAENFKAEAERQIPKPPEEVIPKVEQTTRLAKESLTKDEQKVTKEVKEKSYKITDPLKPLLGKTERQIINLLKRKEPELEPLEIKVTEKEIVVRYQDDITRTFLPDEFKEYISSLYTKTKKTVEVTDPTEPPSITSPEDAKAIISANYVETIDPSNPLLTPERIITGDIGKNRIPESIVTKGEAFVRSHMPILVDVVKAIKNVKEQFQNFYRTHLVSPLSKMGILPQSLIESYIVHPEPTASSIVDLLVKIFKPFSPEERALLALQIANANVKNNLQSHPEIGPLAKSVWEKGKIVIDFIEKTNNFILHEFRKRGIHISEWPQSHIDRIEADIARIMRKPRLTELDLLKIEILREVQNKLKSQKWIPRSYVKIDEVPNVIAASAKTINEAVANTIIKLVEKGRISKEKVKDLLNQISDVTNAKKLAETLGIPEVEIPVQDKIILTMLSGVDDFPLPPIDITPAVLKIQKALGVDLGYKGYAIVPKLSPKLEMQLRRIIPQHPREFPTEESAIKWAIENGMAYILDPVYNYGNLLMYAESKLKLYDTLKAVEKASITVLRENEAQAPKDRKLLPSDLITSDVVILPLTEVERIKTKYGIDLRELGWREWEGQPQLPNLKGRLIHPVLEAWIKDETYVPWFSKWENSNNWLANVVRKIDSLTRTLKFLRFYLPTIMVMNDLGQMWMLGAAAPVSLAKSVVDLPLLISRSLRKAITGKGTIVSGQKHYGFLGYLAEAIYDVASESDLFKTAQNLGLFINPNKYREDVGRLAVDMLKVAQQDSLFKKTVQAITLAYERNAKTLGIPVVGKVLNTLYRDALQWATWKMDQVLRMAALRWYLDKKVKAGPSGELLIQEPLTLKEAVNAVRKFMVNYRGIPHRTRRTLNFVLLTPTYRIEMAKLYKDILSGLIHDPKKWLEPAINTFTAHAIAFTVKWWLRMSFLRLVSSFVGAALHGFDEESLENVKEKYEELKKDWKTWPGWTLRDWYHIQRNLPGGMSEVFVLPSPLFEMAKYISRDPVYTLKMYSSVPVHVLWSLAQNRDWKGDEIVPPFAGPIETASRVARYLITNATVPFLENFVILPQRDDWKWMDYLLSSCAIVHYKTKDPRWMAISAYNRALIELNRLKSRATWSGREEDFKRYQQALEKVDKLREETIKAIKRADSPRVVDALIDAYGKVFGVGREKFKALLFEDLNHAIEAFGTELD